MHHIVVCHIYYTCTRSLRTWHIPWNAKEEKWFVRIVLPLSHNIVLVSFIHGLQDVTLTFNIFNSVLIKNIKIWYYETTHWDESNKIPHEYVFLYIQMRILGQRFQSLTHQKWNKHYIMKGREYMLSRCVAWLMQFKRRLKKILFSSWANYWDGGSHVNNS